MFTNIIQTDELSEIAEHCVILDCRSKLSEAGWGSRQFDLSHLPNAQYLDLDSTLAATPGDGHLGRHPLPSRAAWVTSVRQLGIQNDQQVVLYDDAGGATAGRAWWMFRWLGHAPVALLDGGMASWLRDLVQTTQTPEPSNFLPRQALTKTISAGEITGKLAAFSGRLVDARIETRFAGEMEPIDPIAGHIPGAVCLPFQGNLDNQQKFRPAAELKARFFQDLASEAGLVCYCGSGVTACHNILAMNIAGLDEPALFVDSWSGWISDPQRPIATR